MRKYKNSGYSGGGASRDKPALKTYRPRHFDAKSDIDMNLSLLRDRAADLAMNSAIGAAAIQTQVTETIGSGLKLFPRLKYEELGLTAQEAQEWSRRTKIEFDVWAKNIKSDFSERNNFYEMQRVAYISYLVDGDSFVLFRRRPPSRMYPYSMRLQLIEAQRVSNPLTQGGLINQVEMLGVKKGSRIVNGIEVTREGKADAIWVSNRIWNEPTAINSSLEWRRVKCVGEESGLRNILHICNDTRPDQFRGVPYLAPVIETLRNINRFSEAELTQAIIKSFFSVFFVQPASNFDLNQIADNSQLDVAEYRLGSGTVSALPRGVDVKAIDSSNAQSTFDAFLTAFTRNIGAALNIPYELLTKQFQSSYSASRAAILQAEDEFRQRRAAFVNDFCQPVYEQFLIEAIGTGKIEAPCYFSDPIARQLWNSADWYNERSHGLDVVKELEGAKMRIELGLSTLQKEAAEMTGTDYYDNIRTLRDELAARGDKSEILE